MKWKIAIADDHKIFLESISLLVSLLQDVEVVGQMTNGKQVVDFLKSNEVDIVLSDIGMPQMDGIELTSKLQETHPNVKVLILTTSEDTDAIKQALHAGAFGYLFKSAGKEELERALKSVAAGKKYYSDDLVDKLVLDTGVVQEEIHQLTAREKEVLALIAAEQSSQQIAERLFISLNTVETHRKNLMKKLETKNVVGLIKYAIKAGMING